MTSPGVSVGELLYVDFGLLPCSKLFHLIDENSPVIGVHDIGLDLDIEQQVSSSAIDVSHQGECVCVTSSSGREIRVTSSTEILVKREGVSDFVPANELEQGDVIEVKDPAFGEDSLYSINKDQSYVLGVLSGGITPNMNESGGRFYMVPKHSTQKFDTLLYPYNGDFVEYMRTAFTSTDINNSIRSFMNQVGFLPTLEERIEAPFSVLTGSRAVVKGYLFGLMESVGTLTNDSMYIDIYSPVLAKQVSLMFSGLGLPTMLRPKKINFPLEHDGWEVKIHGPWFDDFLKEFFDQEPSEPTSPPVESINNVQIIETTGDCIHILGASSYVVNGFVIKSGA